MRLIKRRAKWLETSAPSTNHQGRKKLAGEWFIKIFEQQCSESFCIRETLLGGGYTLALRDRRSCDLDASRPCPVCLFIHCPSVPFLTNWLTKVTCLSEFYKSISKLPNLKRKLPIYSSLARSMGSSRLEMSISSWSRLVDWNLKLWSLS